MGGNSKFLMADATQAWLAQFDAADQPLAIELLRAMKLVSRDQFSDRLSQLILRRLVDGDEPIGVYVERELRKRNGKPHRLFKEVNRKVRRAHGVGPQPVQPTKSYDADVGSEGLVAQLVSELCRQHPTRIFNHPGPDQIRRVGIRRFVLVTDFVGSGSRAATYLEAAWRVKSVRSWWSARATKGLSFEVLAYAATAAGRLRVERHASQPELHVVTACPTVRTAFSAARQPDVRSLCSRYSPLPPSRGHALGHKAGGALIAFAHGVPNNAPLMLHKKGPDWSPLFPARVTSSTRAAFTDDVSRTDSIRHHLIAMRQKKLAAADNIAGATPRAAQLLLVLAATARAPRTHEALSRKTGLTILEVDAAMTRALKHGWVDGASRLTDAGYDELKRARKLSEPEALPTEEPGLYYPTSLRALRGDSS